jgi:hypothetical protein
MGASIDGTSEKQDGGPGCVQYVVVCVYFLGIG